MTDDMSDWPVIHSYSRAQAIEDGFLIDVTKDGNEAGFRIPVALTSAVWHECVEWPDSERALQDESGRLWDVVYMAYQAARRAPDAAGRLDYELYVVPRGTFEPDRRTLSLHIGPGDDINPVITITLPNED